MRKINSTNALNEAQLIRNCGVVHALSIIGGRWKPTILFNLLYVKMRYNELLKSIPGVSERMLIAQLRELEQHGLIRRIVYPEVPPRVEYELTAAGKSASPMLQAISDWGNKLRNKKNTTAKKNTSIAPA